MAGDEEAGRNGGAALQCWFIVVSPAGNRWHADLTAAWCLYLHKR